ncbi:serine O-acetyltransferase [Pseudomonas sp. GV085]|uniref:serine O-acetyltransferase n=1 Tax=Pseudomonas sp. GV085 TaxID=2135756 RepID=UPI000D39644B|nr:serine acetyltransferase [Pseudomonas sp. GV085]
MIATQLYRIGNKLHHKGVPGAALFFKMLIRLICNCAIDPRTTIGKGSFFAYGGVAVVIHRNCIIGRNVTISQCVTIGGKSGIADVPIIGNNIYIGAGAIILGNVTIADGATIGAGAVVLNDVGEKEIWAGVPACKINR